jgi:GNAT superfamily N-acetyltransferase
MAVTASWPRRLPVTTVRIARRTTAPDRARAFYAGVVGLPVLAEFDDHDGYSGVVLGLPDGSVELELVDHVGTPAAPVDAEDALVLHVAEDGLEPLRKRLADEGLELLVPANPYWVALGAFAVLDPDGRQVLFVPQRAPGVEVVAFNGDRRTLLDLFREAEDSEEALARHLDDGRVWVARTPDGSVVGHLQAVARDDVWEVLNTAVAPDRRGAGIGRRLLEHAIAEATSAGAARLELATATADIGNLRFYQRCGLRPTRIVRDAFTADDGYDGVAIDGIALRDQIWFELDLTAPLDAR